MCTLYIRVSKTYSITAGLLLVILSCIRVFAYVPFNIYCDFNFQKKKKIEIPKEKKSLGSHLNTFVSEFGGNVFSIDS